MTVDNNLILKLEKLSRLQLSEQERASIGQDLTNILKMVDKLNELPTDGVVPLVYISPAVNVLRDDVVANQLPKQVALRNAPIKDSDFFKVPKFVD